MPEVADSAAASRTSRKEKFRQYFRAFNPTASPVQALRDGLILDTLRSDRFHKIIAARIEVEPCSLQALAGGAGSGKTTELLLVEQHLKSLGHLPIYIEVSLLADLSRAEPGFLSAIVSGQIRSATGSDATLRPTHPIALLIDGLDRTPDMAEFQRLALPDLLFFRTHAIPTVCVAPLALQFMPQPELREQFDRIHALPRKACAAFLRSATHTGFKRQPRLPKSRTVRAA
jgi:hypothetical protein